MALGHRTDPSGGLPSRTCALPTPIPIFCHQARCRQFEVIYRVVQTKPPVRSWLGAPPTTCFFKVLPLNTGESIGPHDAPRISLATTSVTPAVSIQWSLLQRPAQEGHFGSRSSQSSPRGDKTTSEMGWDGCAICAVNIEIKCETATNCGCSFTVRFLGGRLSILTHTYTHAQILSPFNSSLQERRHLF